MAGYRAASRLILPTYSSFFRFVELIIPTSRYDCNLWVFLLDILPIPARCGIVADKRPRSEDRDPLLPWSGRGGPAEGQEPESTIPGLIQWCFTP